MLTKTKISDRVAKLHPACVCGEGARGLMIYVIRDLNSSFNFSHHF